jgi:2',3'-cyclic-nucleotide 2'-phosphodiesterase (5'-nucleotidase family)
MIDALNELNITAACIGNHDFGLFLSNKQSLKTYFEFFN